MLAWDEHQPHCCRSHSHTPKLVLA